MNSFDILGFGKVAHS